MFKNTVSGDWPITDGILRLFQRDRPARLDRPENGIIGEAFVRSSIALCFKFLNLCYEYLIGVQSPWYKNLSYPRILRIFGRTVCKWTSHPLFRQNAIQKCENHTFHVKRTVWVSHKEDVLCNTLTEFWSNKKVSQPIGRKIYFGTVLPQIMG